MDWIKVDKDIIDCRVDVNLLHPTDAAEKTIKEIQDKYPPPYFLMASGGVDSQVMLLMWKHHGKDFIPTAVRYNTSYNSHDLENLDIFSKVNGMDVNYIDFDLLSFLKYDYDGVSSMLRCSSPCISAHYEMVKNLEGTVIFAGDFIHREGLVLSPPIMGLHRATQFKKNLIPFFFLHTPELAYSLFYKPSNIQDYVGLDDYAKKIKKYKIHGFDVIPQPYRTTGFEKIKDYYDEHYYNLVPKIDRLKFAAKHSKRTFDLLLRYPYELRYNDPPKYIFKVNNYNLRENKT